MKYLYYYIWLILAKGCHIVGKPIFYFRTKIRGTRFEVKKIDDDEVIRRKKDLNINNYDYPDGITHWHAFGFFYLFFLIFLFFIPLFFIDSFGENIINEDWKYFVYVILIAIFNWYIIYIKKSNKEWLQKKIDNKKKDFYL